MSREVVQEEVYHLLRCLLNYRIQVSSVKHPCFYILRLLHIINLVANYAINTSTTCISTLSFDFEQTLILENAIMKLEVSFLAIILWVILIGVPTSNERFTDAHLQNQFTTELPSLIRFCNIPLVYSTSCDAQTLLWHRELTLQYLSIIIFDPKIRTIHGPFYIYDRSHKLFSISIFQWTLCFYIVHNNS